MIPLRTSRSSARQLLRALLGATILRGKPWRDKNIKTTYVLNGFPFHPTSCTNEDGFRYTLVFFTKK